ncbi:aquaporin [Protaetiibacter intestinalis]|uniref:Aquaporin n=1 Tax=Protaetiibacter intestinalis TaxID=2419774 RepID=A0A387BLW2_9MICO|nr:aquaporin [Protaetiibacter intestinalis]AYF99520.1 aquaporin [Protaetiibacter intestinalis]
MADSSAPASLVRRLIAETFGTYVLVFGVIGAALFFAPDNGALPVALAVGLAVLTAAYAVGSISGGHFNPAVTLGAAAAGRASWTDVLPYWIAQIVGGLLATLTFGLFGVLSGKTLDFGAVSNGYDAHSPLGFSLGSVLVAEIVATAVFVLIILGVTAAGSTTAGFAPLAIGLSLTMVHLVMIPISNSSVNPARSIATAVLGGPDALAQLWVFLVAPLVGGLLAGVVYRPLFGGRK